MLSTLVYLEGKNSLWLKLTEERNVKHQNRGKFSSQFSADKTKLNLKPITKNFCKHLTLMNQSIVCCSQSLLYLKHGMKTKKNNGQVVLIDAGQKI